MFRVDIHAHLKSRIAVSCNHFLLSYLTHVNLIVPVLVVPVRVRTGAPRPDTKTPKKNIWKKHGERVPPTKVVVQPFGF